MKRSNVVKLLRDIQHAYNEWYVDDFKKLLDDKIKELEPSSTLELPVQLSGNLIIPYRTTPTQLQFDIDLLRGQNKVVTLTDGISLQLYYRT